MIRRLSICLAPGTDPYENLALEAALTMQVKPEECILYLWQNQNTVVIGRNQNAWRECRLSLLEAEGGRLVRRLSGGGAVYHDLGNLNFTFCVRKEDCDVSRQQEVLLRACQMFGIRAGKSGRNDLTVDGRKFSGTAFYQSGEFCYHHGTLLLCADLGKMSRYLQVSQEKLSSHGVASVPSRVQNLQELNPQITCQNMRLRLKEALEEVYQLPAEQLAPQRLDAGQLAGWKERFASWEWNFGRRISFTHQMEKRFAWGNAELSLFVSGGVIRDAVLYTDAMHPEWFLDAAQPLTGLPFHGKTMAQALAVRLQANGAPEETVKEFGAWIFASV